MLTPYTDTEILCQAVEDQRDEIQELRKEMHRRTLDSFVTSAGFWMMTAIAIAEAMTLTVWISH